MNDTAPRDNPTEGEAFLQAVFGNSPNAIFVVNANDAAAGWRIVNCNEAAWRMHGYDRKEDVLGKPLNSLCKNAPDIAAIVEDSRKQGRTTADEIHVKKDKTEIPMHCVYTLVNLGDQEYLLSFQHDLTEVKKLQESREWFQAIFDQSPDGVVLIDPTKGVDYWPIVDCNESFVAMNGYESRDELIGRDILIVSRETAFAREFGTVHLEYRKKFYEKLQNDGAIRMQEVHKRKDNSTFQMEVSTRLITLHGQEYLLGTDRAVAAEEQRLRQIINDLQKDVGRTFHTFQHTLLGVKLGIAPAIEALGPDPFGGRKLPSFDDVWKKTQELRENLAEKLSALLALRYSEFREASFSQSDWEKIEELLVKLRTIEEVRIQEQRLPVLRLAARKASEIVNHVEPGRLPRELIREIRRSAQVLEWFVCRVFLQQAEDDILDTDQLVGDLRLRLVTGSRAEEKPEPCEFRHLLREAITDVANYAESRGVQLREPVGDIRGALVNVVRRDVVRAIGNLLHNAIKYSWSRSEGKLWINLRNYVAEGRVHLEIEDYGVPILAEEIERGLIFEFGFRGSLSADRGRRGAGIGLYDARETARRHGGDVTLTSYPAAPLKPSEDYLKVPHLKTAQIWLPILNATKDTGQ
jgi:PAS domain S-box-containing protein